MKKITLFIFSLIVSLVLFCGFFVKADATLTMVDGAQVRTAGEYQGLRFQANASTLEGVDEHGFYIALGNHSLSDMRTAIEGGEATIGGNKLVKKTASGEDLTFAVTVYDITNTYYATGITAVAYLKTGAVYTLDKVVTKTIAAVALNALNSGSTGDLLTTVATYISSNYKKAYENYAGNFVINNAAYCYDPIELAPIFVQDWNNFVDASDRIDSISAKTQATSKSLVYKDKSGADFYYSAKTNKWQDANDGGERSIYNISSSNLYAFFNDAAMSTKWGWLLDLLYAADNTTHPRRQITAIRGDGTNGSYELYSGQQLALSIINFFTESKVTYYYNGVDFSSASGNRRSYYENMLSGSGTNTTIYNPSLGSTQIGRVGDTITLPADKTPSAGYTWDGYYVGLEKHAGSTSYTLPAGNVSFVPTFNTINYTVTYMDGETDISSLFASSYKTFTIESEDLTLPEYEKDGYTFDGWYDNAGLTGSAVTTISRGTHENKCYYAKTTLGTFEDVNLTLNLNNGTWFNYNASSIANVRADFRADAIAKENAWASVYGNAAAADAFGVNGTILGVKVYKWDGLLAYFAAVNTNANMQWFFNYYKANHTIPNRATSQAAGYDQTCDTYYLSYDGWQWYSSLAASKTNGSGGSGRLIITAENVYNTATLSDVMTYIQAAQANEFVINGATLLPTPYRAGYTFGGWYDNAGCTGEAITTYPGVEVADTSVTLYAKWVAE